MRRDLGLPDPDSLVARALAEHGDDETELFCVNEMSARTRVIAGLFCDPEWRENLPFIAYHYEVCAAYARAAATL